MQRSNINPGLWACFLIVCGIILMSTMGCISSYSDRPARGVEEEDRIISLDLDLTSNRLAVILENGMISIRNATDLTLTYQFEYHNVTNEGEIARWMPLDGNQLVAWSPSGKYLATSGGNQTVRIWHPSNWTIVTTLTLNATKPINTVAWSPEGGRIAVSSLYRMAVWNTTNWSMERFFKGKSYEGISWDPINPRLAAMTSLGDEITLWNITTWEVVVSSRNVTDTRGIIVWSPDGSMMGMGQFPHNVVVLSTDDFQPIATLKGHPSSVLDLAWSSDGQFLASSSWGWGDMQPERRDPLRVWEISSWDEANVMNGDYPVSAVVWDGEDQDLITGCYDGKIRVWDADKDYGRNFTFMEMIASLILGIVVLVIVVRGYRNLSNTRKLEWNLLLESKNK
jgi:dipeptidyl aminopeptidase/acylaminoacyl peptidase